MHVFLKLLLLFYGSVSYRTGCQGKVYPYGNNRKLTRIKINHNNITDPC